MKRISITIFIIMAVCFCKPNLLSAQVNVQDSLALVDFYNSTNGPNWYDHTNWLTIAPVSTWNGIVVTGKRVTGVGFGSNGLNGPIPSSFGNLSALKYVSIFYGNITGPIPSSFGNLTSLESCAFGFCLGLTGPIPASIGKLKNLQTLYLYSNNIHGIIPSSLGNLKNLIVLVLAGNKLNGNIPESLNKLTNLKALDLSFNKLSGKIPDLSDLHNDTALSLRNNRFTFGGMENLARNFSFSTYAPQAKIPLNNNGNALSVSAGGDFYHNVYSWYKDGNLIESVSGDSTYRPQQNGLYSATVSNSVATALTLYSDAVNFQIPYVKINQTDSLALVDFYNNLNGPNWIDHTNWLTPAPVSTWFGIGVDSDRVTHINFFNNSIGGQLPASFGNLTALVNFSAAYGITGTLPSSMGNLKKLQSLSLFFCNDLTGPLPASLGNLENLQSLYLYSNNIHGAIPSSFGNLKKLKSLILSANNLTGDIPNSLNNLTNLKVLDLSFNRLSGKIPDLSNLEKDTTFSLRNNKFTFAGMENLVRRFPFAEYQFQAKIPVHQNSNILSVSAGGELAHNSYTWYNNSTLVAIIRGDSTFQPTENGNYSVAVTNSVATSLTLYSDTINYIIPGINKTDSLALVDLYNNTNGPNWTNHTNWLTTAPVSTWYGVNVDINRRVNDLSLSNNNLSGKLPSSLGNLSALYTLNLSTNNLNDEIPASLAKISKLENLDLSVNKLSGEIPDSIGNLLNLTTLNLSVNKLNGKIPSTLNKFTELLDLFLNDNQLEGQIPHLSGKYNILLQNNKLSGEVPYIYCENISLQGNELSTISPDFYGNEFSTIYVALENNMFNYSTLENVERYYQSDAIYSPQAKIPLNKNGNKLFAKAGGTIANNTYKWYKGATLVATINGDSTYTPTISGKYSVAVTNSVATRVTLYSDTLKYTVSDNLIAGKINTKISPASVYPNPAKSNTTVLFNADGKYTISISDVSGKVLQTKTGISNKQKNIVKLNVSNYAGGIYFITIIDEKNKKQTIKLNKE